MEISKRIVWIISPTKCAINIIYLRDTRGCIIISTDVIFDSDKGVSCSLERQILANDKLFVLADNHRSKTRYLLPVQLLVRNYQAVQVEG